MVYPPRQLAGAFGFERVRYLSGWSTRWARSSPRAATGS